MSPWAYIIQRAFLVGLYLGVGGYNLVPRVSCLSDIELHRRPISERQETLRERMGGVIIGIYISFVKGNFCREKLSSGKIFIKESAECF